MKICIITQPDSLVIPRNVALLIDSGMVDLASIIVVKNKGSLSNKIGLFLKGFGYSQMGKLLVVKVVHCLAKIINREVRTLRDIAKSNGGKFKVVTSLDDCETRSHLESLHLELIVSYSAPVVFSEAILKIPRHGCINLHCSKLPMYAGLLPSFWVLYHGEKSAGATVHYMDDKIDNGAILGQVEIPLKGTESMYEVILTTKRIGGDLMLSVIREIKNGNMKTIPNNLKEGSYFTWPTICDIRDFRRRGGRFI